MSQEIHRVCVCGAGTMGAGIAQTLATAGYSTLVYDVQPAGLERAAQQIEKQLDGAISKGKLAAGSTEKILQRIEFTNDLQACLADLFIEAIVERMEDKVALFNQLAELNHSESIFATNTSSLSVTHLSNQVQNPARVIGLHFFNPAHLMKLVEVITTRQTDPKVLDTAWAWVESIGKKPVRCADTPGFIVNRVARPYYLEAMRLVETGDVSPEQVDRILESAGFKLGPFQLTDLIGQDINLVVSRSVYEQLGRPLRLKPSSLQEEKVNEGKLGRKTGEGFYRY
ncbi:MAG: 3-hydroxybutyryl-CoA dehydrogenase [Bacteroidetes bacterium]|nr:3-hydroxybutyryl-CoA dehydrogenase [Bacteroidota bacterium]